jgi:hypothetical protein
LVVAVLATLQGSGDLAIGNILGSNLANVGLILGATALVRPLVVLERVVRREIPIMLLLTLLLFPLMRDLSVDRLDGVFLCLILATYLAYVFHQGKKAPPGLISGYSRLAGKSNQTARKAVFLDLSLLVAGVLGLVLGGKAIVESATFLAREMGVSEMTIGLTLVAVGTSLPELATSLMAAFRKQTDIAVGNGGGREAHRSGAWGPAGGVPCGCDPFRPCSDGSHRLSAAGTFPDQEVGGSLTSGNVSRSRSVGLGIGFDPKGREGKRGTSRRRGSPPFPLFPILQVG